MKSSSFVENNILRILKDREIFYSSSSSSSMVTHLQRHLQGSTYQIERMQLLHTLEGHEGCVNTIHYSESGQYLITGSDDTNVKLYHSFSGEEIAHFPTLHRHNIFYAKDLPTGEMVDFSYSQGVPLWIVTCAADGRVALLNTVTKCHRLLYHHRGHAHRIAMVPNQSHQFYSCGEDGLICFFDLRDKTERLVANPPDEMLAPIVGGNALPSLKIDFQPRGLSSASIYALGVNPMNTYEVAAAGNYCKVCLYDIRKPSTPYKRLCPNHLVGKANMHITGLKYSYNGEMLIASYSDDDIYAFFTGGDVMPTSFRFGNRMSASSRERVMNEDEKEEVPEEEDEDNLASTRRPNWLTNNCLSRVFGSMVGWRYGGSPSQSASRDEISDTEEESAWLEEVTDRGYLQRYSGHLNSETVKQVNFLGGQSEFVVSGSDCGHIFIWDSFSSRLVKVLDGDENGAINCFASHPTLPYFASCGLDSNAKVWAPIGPHEPLTPGSRAKLEADGLIERNASRESINNRSAMLFSRRALRMMLSLAQSTLSRSRNSTRSRRQEGGDDVNVEDEDEDDQPRRQRMRILEVLAAMEPFSFLSIPRSDDDDDESVAENEEEASGDSEMYGDHYDDVEEEEEEEFEMEEEEICDEDSAELLKDSEEDEEESYGDKSFDDDDQQFEEDSSREEDTRDGHDAENAERVAYRVMTPNVNGRDDCLID